MRQLYPRASRLRFFVLVAALSLITLAASGPIHSAVRGSHVTGDTSASRVATADCSLSTALQVAQPLFVWGNDVSKPIAQVLCGAFTGPGSEAMVVTFNAPTCWSPQGWAVFRFTGGAWQLVMVQRYEFIFPPLVAVGGDIRETTPVFRSGDSRCGPTGGRHARIWHWDGTRLVAGSWRQVTKGEPARRGFYSPSHKIACGMYDDSGFRSVDCQSFAPKLSQTAKLNLSGHLAICQDRGTQNRCNIGNPGEGTPTLGYGKQITVGRFRCLSLRSGMRCTVIRSGKGFLINSASVRRVGP
jgi:hypothetical protein